MFKKFLKDLKPMHVILGVLAFFIAVTIVVLIARTVNFADFITKTENKTFDSSSSKPFFPKENHH